MLHCKYYDIKQCITYLLETTFIVPSDITLCIMKDHQNLQAALYSKSEKPYRLT
jgi:hypothetical protein